jgi:hypothetical protein
MSASTPTRRHDRFSSKSRRAAVPRLPSGLKPGMMAPQGMVDLYFETFIVYFVVKVVLPSLKQGGAVKSSIIRALLTLTATGAIVAGYGDMPTASATPPSTPGRTPAPSTSSTPLSVSVTCGPNYESPQTCIAEASGGSGTGYTFTWENGVVKSEQGGTSQAIVECPDNYSYTYETVSVTDSNGAYADTQAQLWCSHW